MGQVLWSAGCCCPGDHPHAGNGAPNVYFAEDLDRGFQAPADDDHVVADTASVAEVVIRDEVSSVASGDLVIDEGDVVAPGAAAPGLVIRDLKQTLEAARWTPTGSKISRSRVN